MAPTYSVISAAAVNKLFVIQTLKMKTHSLAVSRIAVRYCGLVLLGSSLLGCAVSQNEIPNPPREIKGERDKPPAELLSAPPPSPGDGEKAPPAIADGQSIFFAQGSAKIDQDAIQVLEIHAAKLRSNPKLVVTLIGHSDHLGSRSYNIAIAEQRVAAVAKALRGMDVQRGQIRKLSLGNEKPGGSCQSEDCRRKWRRVDLSYPKPRVERRVGRKE